MQGVVTGFVVILTIIAAGYIASCTKVVSRKNRNVLNRVAFFVATPALLFTVVAESSPATIISPVIVVAMVTAVIVAVIYMLISWIFFRSDLATTTITVASSGYMNANNIGLPVGIYVIGEITYVPPLILLQVLIFAPMIIAILESTRGSRGSFLNTVLRSLSNPIIIATVLGFIIALLGWRVPPIIFDPLEQLGGAAIPLVLLAFGASIQGERLLVKGTGLRQVAVSSAIKVLLAPLVAWLIAGPIMQLDAHSIFAVVVISALPTAQNMYNFAATYQRGEVIARNIVFVTTFASLPALFLIALLLQA